MAGVGGSGNGDVKAVLTQLPFKLRACFHGRQASKGQGLCARYFPPSPFRARHLHILSFYRCMPQTRTVCMPALIVRGHHCSCRAFRAHLMHS